MKIQCNPHGGLLIACILLAYNLPTPPPSPTAPRSLYVFRGKEGMIHLFTRSHVKKPVPIGPDTICLTKVCSDWLKIDVTKTRNGEQGTSTGNKKKKMGTKPNLNTSPIIQFSALFPFSIFSSPVLFPSSLFL